MRITTMAAAAVGLVALAAATNIAASGSARASVCATSRTSPIGKVSKFETSSDGWSAVVETVAGVFYVSGDWSVDPHAAIGMALAGRVVPGSVVAFRCWNWYPIVYQGSTKGGSVG